jgi:penicillin-binding protein 2
MASVPSFDPNTFIPSVSAKDWAALIKDDTNPLVNRAISSYAPGSTYKPITAFAGLRKGIGGRSYTCSGGVQYGDKFMKCHIFGKGTHGTIGLADAIKYSCNAFFFQYGNEAGIDQIETIGKLLGLGQKTGVELTSEATGTQPGRNWLAARTPRARWSDGQTANTSIGQGYVEATPLQMALIAATVANGGTCFYPRLIDKVTDRDGNIDLQDPPRVRTNLLEEGLTAQQIEVVRRGMWKVVNEAGGTAARARLKGVQVAGKTGTAEFYRNGEKDNHTWFLSFAPYEAPRFAIAVLVQGAKSGGGVSAPISAKIMEECLALEQGAEVKLAALAPAPGSFRFISQIDYSKADPVISMPDETATDDADGIQNPDDERVVAQRGRERDREQQTEVRRAEPVIRADADARGQVPVRAAVPVNRPAPPGATPAPRPETPPLNSVRKFFQRGNDTPASDATPPRANRP